MFYNSLSACSLHESAELFNEYFHWVDQSKSIIPESFNFISSTFFPLLLSEISHCEQDIFPIYCFLDTSKAMDIDKIGQKILKSCASSFFEPITLLLQKYINFDLIPQECKVPLITPILIVDSFEHHPRKNIFDAIHIYVLPIISLKQFGFV